MSEDKGYIVFEIQTDSKAKPAGVKGKFGNIHQNRNGYHKWTDLAVTVVKAQMSELDVGFPVVPYGVILQHYPANFKCGDILNIAGATMDVIKKAGVIKDDSPNNVSRVITDMLRVKDSSYTEPTIVITVCLTSQAYFGLLRKIYQF